MRNKFDRQLAQLNDMLVEMGVHIEKSIALSAKALREQDAELAKEVIALEDEIDQMEKDIESLCMKLLLQQQPVAGDLRLISAALKMVTDMERIGDQATDIAEIILTIEGNPCMEQYTQMADSTIKMVRDSIDAFVKKDLQTAQDVVKYDDVVDDLFDTIKLDLIERIRNDCDNKEWVIDLLMIAKYFERIGDHAVNIAEWAAFSITGHK